jgi:putative addiction module killer protein
VSALAYNSVMKIFKSDAYNKWFKTETVKTQKQIEARLVKIELENYLGNHKHLVGELWELKFNNGNRIYYTIKKIGDQTMFLILGGNKNGQQKDINKAEKVAKEIHKET